MMLLKCDEDDCHHGNDDSDALSADDFLVLEQLQ